MPSLDRVQLSALGDGVDDLTRRAFALAEQFAQNDSSDGAQALYEAERSLRMASRAIERAARALRP